MSFPPTDLFSAIGLFIVNFGVLEYFTFGHLYDHFSQEEYKRAEKNHFNDRMEKVLSHLATLRTDKKSLEAIAEFRERLAPLRDLRNNIDHGYMLMKLPDEGMPSLRIVNPRHQALPRSTSGDVTFEDILQSLEELTEVTEILKSLLGYRDETP